MDQPLDELDLDFELEELNLEIEELDFSSLEIPEIVFQECKHCGSSIFEDTKIDHFLITPNDKKKKKTKKAGKNSK